MYFEARTHRLFPVYDAEQAAKFIKNKHLSDYHCPTWQQDGKTYIAVPDGHINDVFFEIAFIKKEADTTFTQFESITAGWCTEQELIKYLQDTTPAFNKKVQLIIDNPKGNEFADFECGCCGGIFNSNVKYQQHFGQDSGYGICKECECYYK